MNPPLPIFKVSAGALAKINVQYTEIEIRQKMRIAVNLRKQGFSYSHIGETINCSPQYATALIKKAMREVTEESANELVKQELERLNAIFVPAFIEATKTDAKGDPIYNSEATNTVIRVMERRAKLMGLDKPTKTEFSGALDIGEKSVQIYIPHNGRDLPKGVIIENGEIVNDAVPTVTTQDENEIHLEFEIPADEDLSGLFEDEFNENFMRENSAR